MPPFSGFLCAFAFKQPCPVPVAHSLIAVKYRPAAKSKQPDHLQNPLASGISTRDPLVRARRPTLLALWAIWMPGRCGYWFASLMVPSPEGWYILCRGRRPRLQVQSKIREARRAGTSSAEVEGPGCRCKVKSERPGGPTHRIYYATHGHSLE